MDKGARYYRCDFQVHTPRDNQWAGERPVTDESRKSYGKKFVAACRAKKLDAVAITDHHDLCFFPFIKAAAAEEVDAAGTPVPEHSRVIVFPGMELTLAVPCQAIVIFDADMSPTQLEDIYPLLGWSRPDYSQPFHRQAESLRFQTFEELLDQFDSLEHFRGRYILLPNVTEKGHQTLMRQHFALKYREMACVGGYVDKPVSSFGQGFMQKLDGHNHEFGNKPLGLFQTSDNRCETFTKLGSNTSWVKWSTPTAEALRQACLARVTRISQERPVVPTMVVSHLAVSDSQFLNEIDLHLNPQFNCLIGGRGTGKSTILEYIRWALCDQPPAYTGEDEAAPYQEKRGSLIEKTLVPVKGVVSVTFELNSVQHVVRRSSETKELKLKIGQDEYRDCTEQQVRDLLPLQAYSQKQLSAVGIRAEELTRFIRTSIKSDLDQLRHEMEGRKTQLRQAFSALVHRRKLQRDLDRDNLELASLTKQVEAVKKGLSGLTGDDRRVLDANDSFQREERLVDNFEKQLETARDMANDFRQSLSAMAGNPPDASLPNAALIGRIRTALNDVIEGALVHVDAAIRELAGGSDSVAHYAGVQEEWRGAHAAHKVAYEKAKQVASSQQDLLRQIAETDEKIRALRRGVDEREAQIRLSDASEEEFNQARRDWMSLYTTAADMMQVKCDELTQLSSKRIMAKINRGASSEKLRVRLTGLLAGTGMRSRKIEELCDHVTASPTPFQAWAEVVDELEKLIDYTGGSPDEPRSREAPLLTTIGYGPRELDRIASKLTPEEWIELALIELDDVPEFKYRQSEGLYINFADASAGQQATALLRVLLNQEGPPLVIDQPEEDLDNQVIQEIVQEIWKAKHRRQIIFSSHNPNIVVNGDADLVICCDYKTAGDHSGGKIKCRGAIDVEEIRREITTVMEGGREAFRLRKEKYGF